MRISADDLVVDQLCWYVSYVGDSRPPPEELVRVLTVDPKIFLLRVYHGVTVEHSDSYSWFESVHPQFLENKIKALEGDQIRIADQLAVLNSLKGCPV